MLNIVRFCTLLLFGALVFSNVRGQSEFSVRLREVDSLAAIGQAEKALEVCRETKNKARNDRNHPALIRSALTEARLLRQSLPFLPLDTLFSPVEKEIALAGQPLKGILQAAYAGTLEKIYFAERARLLAQAEVGAPQLAYHAQQNPPAFPLHSSQSELAATHRKISALYAAATANPKVYKGITAGRYRTVLEADKNLIPFQPLLIDVIAFRAAAFWQAEFPNIAKEKAFLIRYKTDFFDPYAKFAYKKFESADTNLHAFRIAQLFKELFVLHLADAKPFPLVAADLLRLRTFKEAGAFFYETDSLYFKGLQALLATQGLGAAGAFVYRETAAFFNESGQKCNVLDPKDPRRGQIKVAKAYCDTAIKRFPKTFGATLCLRLKKEIIKKELGFYMENAVLPDSSFLISVNYRNIGGVFIKIVQAPPDSALFFTGAMSEAELALWCARRPSFKATKSKLPAGNDYLPHSAELGLPPLPAGFYLIGISTTPEFLRSKGLVAVKPLWVTNVAALKTELPEKHLYFPVNRAEGKPLKNVSAQLFLSEAVPKTGKRTFNKIDDLEPNEKGVVEIPSPKSYNRHYQLLWKQNGKTVYSTFAEQLQSRQPVDKEPPIETRTAFLTDRAVYLTGEALLFKAIIYQKMGGEWRALAGAKTTVTLYSPNQTPIKSFKLTTGDAGSVSATLVLPDEPGLYSLENEFGRYDFAVRTPTQPSRTLDLRLELTPIKNGQTRQATVEVRAESGAPAKDAEFVYRAFLVVSRKLGKEWVATFPIETGFARTNAAGTATLPLTALANSKFKSSDGFMQEWVVLAELTRQPEVFKLVKLSFSEAQLLFEIQAAQTHYKEFPFEIKINHAYELASANNLHTVTIHKLRTPQRHWKTRKWPEPDAARYDKNDFVAQFPEYPFLAEGRPESRETEKVVFSKSGRTHTFVAYPPLDWEPGWYKITAKTETKDKLTAEKTTYFQVLSTQDVAKNGTETLQLKAAKNKIALYENAVFFVATPLYEAQALIEIFQNGKPLSRYFDLVSFQPKELSFTSHQLTPGVLTCRVTLVARNEVFQKTETIVVEPRSPVPATRFATSHAEIKQAANPVWKFSLTQPATSPAETFFVLADRVEASRLPAIWARQLPNQVGATTLPRSVLDEGCAAKLTVDFRKNKKAAFDWRFAEFDAFGWEWKETSVFSPHSWIAAENKLRKSLSRKKVGAEADLPQIPDAVFDFQQSQWAKPEWLFARQPLELDMKRSENLLRIGQLKYSSGQAAFAYRLPEETKQWKFWALTHTADLRWSLLSDSFVTQQPFVLSSFYPKYLREGDRFELTAEVKNASEFKVDGQLELQVYDGETNKPLSAQQALDIYPFQLQKTANQVAKWGFTAPKGVKSIDYKLTAKSGAFVERQNGSLAVASRNQLFQRSKMDLMKNANSFEVDLDPLLLATGAGEIIPQKFQINIAASPEWYVLQTLPVLIDEQAEYSTEHCLAGIFACLAGEKLQTYNPRLSQTLEEWRGLFSDSLAALWIDQPDEQFLPNQPERLRFLMAKRLSQERLQAKFAELLEFFKNLQLGAGSFAWYKGMPENRQLTQRVVAALGKIRGFANPSDPNWQQLYFLAELAITEYLDPIMFAEYAKLSEQEVKANKLLLTELLIQYLYARSYFPEIAVREEYQKAYQFWQEQAKKHISHYKEQPLFLAMLCVVQIRREANLVTKEYAYRQALQNLKSFVTAKKFEETEKSRSFLDEQWFNEKTVLRALLIETFTEAGGDQPLVEQWVTQLLSYRKNYRWKSGLASLEACYAILLENKGTIPIERLPDAAFNRKELAIDYSEKEIGFCQTLLSAAEISAQGNALLLNQSGAARQWVLTEWSYQGETPTERKSKLPVLISKKVWAGEKNQMKDLNEAVKTNQDDVIYFRIKIETPRELEYLELTDEFPAGFEPVILNKKYMENVGYFEVTESNLSRFFIERLPVGVTIIEYPLKARFPGQFTSGKIEISCQYFDEAVVEDKRATLYVK